MDITIKTVKLQKKHVGQMEFLAVEDLESANVLGYMINCRTKCPKLMLLEKDGEYYVFDTRWEKGEKSFSFMVGRWSRSKEFETEKECSHYWDIYVRARDEAFKNHIYL